MTVDPHRSTTRWAQESAGPDPLAEPAVFAVAGDWHMNAEHAKRAVEYAAERGATTILHTGDFGYTFGARFVKHLHRALEENGVTLLFVDGNHEDFGWLYAQPLADNGLRPVTSRIWHLPRGFRWTWRGKRFLACGGAYSVDRAWRGLNTSWWPEEEITEEEIARCVGAGRTDVLLSHDCPSGVMIPGVDDRPLTQVPYPHLDLMMAKRHRGGLRRIVDAVQPDRIWHGHYHVPYVTEIDFGYGPVTVTGLDRDGSALTRNIQIVEACL